MAKCILDTLKIKPDRSMMSKGQAAQLDRVKSDERKEADAKYVAADRRDTYRAFWNEALEEASKNKRFRYDMMEIQTELKLGNETLTKVRRVQLENLLNAEKEQYREELNNMGLTLYKERW